MEKLFLCQICRVYKFIFCAVHFLSVNCSFTESDIHFVEGVGVEVFIYQWPAVRCVEGKFGDTIVDALEEEGREEVHRVGTDALSRLNKGADVRLLLHWGVVLACLEHDDQVR